MKDKELLIVNAMKSLSLAAKALAVSANLLNELLAEVKKPNLKVVDKDE